jgi:hypothetical protein
VTLFDYLLTPIGMELTHAVIVLIVAAAALMSYAAHRVSSKNQEMLNGHLEEHQRLAEATTRSRMARTKLHM